jgi:hypothetical protein
MPRCTACGTDNKAVAKFCRQCGAPMAQSAPGEDDDRTVIIPSTSTPPRTSPAASASGTAVPAEVVPPARHREADAAKSTRRPQPGKSAKGMEPLIALAVAVLVVLAGGGYFLWNATSEKPAAAPVEQPPASQPPAPPAAAPVPQPVPATAEPVPAVSAVPPQAESAAPPATTEETLAKPMPETTPEALSPPPTTASDKKAKDKATAKAARAERRKREAAENARRAASAPPGAVVEAPPTAPPVPKPDPETARWAKMKQELSECGSLHIFCREGVRWKYCNGYWGKVPACPSSGKN